MPGQAAGVDDKAMSFWKCELGKVRFHDRFLSERTCIASGQWLAFRAHFTILCIGVTDPYRLSPKRCRPRAKIFHASGKE